MPAIESFTFSLCPLGHFTSIDIARSPNLAHWVRKYSPKLNRAGMLISAAHGPKRDKFSFLENCHAIERKINGWLLFEKLLQTRQKNHLEITSYKKD
jgi:hypothetical protein